MNRKQKRTKDIEMALALHEELQGQKPHQIHKTQKRYKTHKRPCTTKLGDVLWEAVFKKWEES